jgi:uncharacterized Zn-finger protein
MVSTRFCSLDRVVRETANASLRRALIGSVWARGMLRSAGRPLSRKRKRKRMTRVHCAICGKGYATNAGLSAHRRASGHLSDGRTRPRCDECGKEFAYKSGLSRHKATVHSPLRGERQQLTCPTCSKQFVRLDNLKRHQSREHPSSAAN